MRSILFTLMVLLSRGVLAQTDALITVYADSGAASCNISVPFPGPSVDVYVIFTPGVFADGILSAQFRVDGMPEGWIAELFPNPSAVSEGSLLGLTGVHISFPTCQSGAPIVLYRMHITPTSAVSSRYLAIRVGAHPLGVSCPVISSCPPVTYQELGETVAILNGEDPCGRSGGCPVTDVPLPPPPPTWGRMKVLYR